MFGLLSAFMNTKNDAGAGRERDDDIKMQWVIVYNKLVLGARIALVENCFIALDLNKKLFVGCMM